MFYLGKKDWAIEMKILKSQLSCSFLNLPPKSDDSFVLKFSFSGIPLIVNNLYHLDQGSQTLLVRDVLSISGNFCSPPRPKENLRVQSF